MASVENIPPVNNDSEMEEGEIVDDLDDLSDISSEEEFLLRQRLQVLENYNNVLERKKAKRASILSGKNEKGIDIILHESSEISTNKDEHISDYKKYSQRQIKETYQKSSHRQKQKNYLHNGCGKDRDGKRKNHRKKRLQVKVVSDSSDKSDDEHRNKRRKLANAVVLNKFKVDTSLKARLEKMCGKKNDECLSKENIDVTNKTINLNNNGTGNLEDTSTVGNIEKNIAVECIEEKDMEIKVINICNLPTTYHKGVDVKNCENNKEKIESVFESIDLCDDDSKDDGNFNRNESRNEDVDSCNKENTPHEKDSDDELEVLRQHALKSKNLKTNSQIPEPMNLVHSKPQSEDDDSDTADLRLICLKSALLKKAIEMKLKQKKRKKFKSKSISLQDDLMMYEEEMGSATDSENNTDIESVDMDIGSDGDDKVKDSNVNFNLGSEHNTVPDNKNNLDKNDEIEEDEDLLRAKLLTSLSKNLPNLLDMDLINSNDNSKSFDNNEVKHQTQQNELEEKKFIINLEDSDSEGEHEATKNLTKMHVKLSEQVEFQQKLDLFLKSTRMQVENDKLPDVVQQSPVARPNAKYIPKAVTHLPKSEQIEYRNLVKRMAELEKIKQARQTTMNIHKNVSTPKETLKPKNITTEAKKMLSSNIEEKIALSRKNIAEESAKMLKLKEEAKKLLQKYKIVATELRNISTAITLNKKEQRMVQNKLSRIRVQHQVLLKSSHFTHSTEKITHVNPTNNKVVNKVQKENNPSNDDYKMPSMLKAVTVSVVNNLRKENNNAINSKLSVQVDVNSNKKIVMIPKTSEKERIINLIKEKTESDNRKLVISSGEMTTCDNKDIKLDNPVIETNCSKLVSESPNDEYCESTKLDKKDIDASEYQSPLEAIESTTWQEDPNAFLCPYEVGGSCRDSECKFLHPKIPSHQ